jgi:hypothetical protein
MTEPTVQELVEAGIKANLLIASDDSQYDADIALAAAEAIGYVTINIVPFDEEFEFDGEMVDLTAIASCIGSGIFKKRQMPQDMDMGWWAQGLKRLDNYITVTYKKGTVYFVGHEEE